MKHDWSEHTLTWILLSCHNPDMSNLIQRTTELAMHIVSGYVRPGDTVIDATCGNGHDTLRLAKMGPKTVFAFDVQPEAIDATRALLQQEGFPVSKDWSVNDDSLSACKDWSVNSDSLSACKDWSVSADAPAGRARVVLACLGHERMAEFFRANTGPETSYANAGPETIPANTGPEGFASAIVFNLGYLPGGDKARTTKAETTLEAVRASLFLLKKNGLLCLTMYSGHPEGAEEKRALLAFAEGLDPKHWHVCSLSMPNQKNHPPEILLISRKK